MIYSEFKGKKISALGFGTMRMPVNESKTIDIERSRQMVERAIESGINYFDTARPYHSGEAEPVIGKLLSEYPRDSYYLATKYPGHQLSTKGYNPQKVFEEQLKACQVEYFDFYLLHNVYEKSMEVYLDPQWGIIDYFVEQKRLGRIKHLGFSCHAQTAGLREFLDACGDKMEFCQIQLNYLDWTLQDAKGKYELLKERNIPIWVMEPVRGGKLAVMNEENTAALTALRPKASVASWAFRFLQDLPQVKVVLSGMSNMEQLEDNIATFSRREPLSEEERTLLFQIAEGMKNSVPCTACRYCCEGCPKGLDIPKLIMIYNEIRFALSMNAATSMNTSMWSQGLPEGKTPADCIGCGKCERICPQNIPIPQVMKQADEVFRKLPSWAEVCRQREAEGR